MANRFAIAGITVLTGLVLSPTIYAQTNPNNNSTTAITTAVPFLRISPDARSGAMGDVGIALSPDADAQYWNVGKIAASDKNAGLSVTYTPWLKDITPDVFLAYIAGYKKFGQGNNQALSASLRYFNLGNINYTDINAQPAGEGKPREFAVDLGYSRNLSEFLSMGIALRYINSNIAAGASSNSGSYKAGNAFSADMGLYYHKTKQMSEDRAGTFSAGVVLSNVGSKITYSQERKDFIPANLGIGAAYCYQVDKFNKITGELDLNKTIVPVPKVITDDQGNQTWEPATQGEVAGILNSFVDAPPGYGTTVSVGGEYWYQDQFALRAGYFYENPDNGDRQYFTVGLGVRYNVFGLDFSYLIPSGAGTARNPLSNTLRFTLSFNFDKLNLNSKS